MYPGFFKRSDRDNDVVLFLLGSCKGYCIIGKGNYSAMEYSENWLSTFTEKVEPTDKLLKILEAGDTKHSALITKFIATHAVPTEFTLTGKYVSTDTTIFSLDSIVRLTFTKNYMTFHFNTGEEYTIHILTEQLAAVRAAYTNTQKRTLDNPKS